VLEKNQACTITSLKFHQLKPVLDIYIVADTDGKEMVLKLHRLALNLVFGFPQNLTRSNQSRPRIISSDQGEERLPWEAEVCIVDVYVAPSCPERMGFYESGYPLPF